MKVAYINDSVAIMWPEAMEDKTPYDIKQVVADLLAIRTVKDVLDFIVKTPPSFFSNIARKPMTDLEIASDFYSGWGSDPRVRGNMEDAVEKSYPDIEVLDGFAVREGVFGPFIENYCLAAPKDDDPVYTAVVYPTKPYYSMLVGTLESLAFDLQAIAKIGAIANGETSPDALAKLPIECDVPVKIIDSGLSISSDFNEMPCQTPPVESFFTEDQITLIQAELEKAGFEKDFEHLYHGEGLGSLFLYPEDMPDRDCATSIFLSFMNSLFEGDAETMYSGNIFKVVKGRRGFKVVDHPGPLRDMYRQCAYLVAEDNIRLCAYCGKPVLADKSRGNEAMYCSRTCNTKASAQRRETAYALAASGVPMEEAVSKIGERYSDSIARWYKEAKALLD